MSENKIIKKVAILGAGVMGAQIAAQCINVGLPVVLFDLPSKSDDGKPVNKNAIALKAIENLKKLKPAPLGLANDANLIQAANYEDDLGLLAGCDLIIEAIAERLDWKHALYEKVAPHIPAHALFATNTSGLPIGELAKGFSGDLKKRFCGVHFFNPPRYMHLLELIPAVDTEPAVLDTLETFMTSTMGKGVVRAKDTPNFIGNRVGVFSILAVFAEAQKFCLGFDAVDAITGSKLGRAKSATFRTSDVVGLDTMAHVIKTMENSLQADPFSALFKVPEVVAQLISKGALGQKTKAGFYRKDGKNVMVLDATTGEYKASTATIEPLVERILKKPIAERLGLLRETDEPQAQFLWAIYRDIFHYCAIQLGDIAQSAREIDFAMRWGYGWDKGPFEDWQAAGVTQVANWIKEDIDAGKALSKEPLPAWLFSGPVAEKQAFHTPEGSWSASENKYIPRSDLPVYQKQVFRAPLLGDGSPDPKTAGTTIYENPDLRAWVEDREPTVLIASFRSKMNTISPDVLNGIQKAVEIAEANYAGLVIWQPSSLKLGTPGGPFSAGANLEAALPMVMKGGPAGVEPFVKLFQDTMMRVKYAQVPVVTAVSGIALGGGCELVMQSARRVTAIESYIGLVEVGVGLLPAGGGLKEAAIRAAQGVALAGNTNYLDFTKASFENAAMAKVSSSAQDAMRMAYLQKGDIIVPNVYELLAIAQNQVKAMQYAGYKPPISALIPVGGRSVAATVMGQVVNMRDGGFISEHDAFIAKKIIEIITGGNVDAGTLVTEEWLLKLERQAFVELIGHPKTMERIMGILQNGKPVRN
ncbi:3-hydroxyacyl-CoA dehydrogenase/enoyl-CoA hydratase family protein [Polynucleobacter sp. MWH-Braz-FAM2G]|uniref:3-hydroxyacyl-CoA dehydrogenase/enoyl-CoA hydratase family protein n=1 Tax=Polynucleobacter sp. MWH-Braz-FAM2G TaxID=1855883 RepID=UPI001BFDE8A5|nr:3-hydroxyacyl-CoA dehydrogenase/enoyl-CoA hydratase family protein [Polynucleobacter sp. MWH-Braz-FAM2G]QWD91687.1 3-hydroxyacyl-CoA dehydrogenase/enoyl-CoA hydratase family protein [Polynucleobacter sp. MWH-Braz-FAM2G]